jgi:hypothetical protein
MIVVAGCGLLLVGIYLITPLLAGSTSGKVVTTQNEEEQLANAIANYVIMFQKFPAADNAALTKNLTGDNPQQFRLLNLADSSTNKDGELVDVWSTPYKFAFVSTNSFTIISAGGNKTFGDADDVIFNSASNTLPKP